MDNNNAVICFEIRFEIIIYKKYKILYNYNLILHIFLNNKNIFFITI